MFGVLFPISVDFGSAETVSSVESGSLASPSGKLSRLARHVTDAVEMHEVVTDTLGQMAVTAVGMYGTVTDAIGGQEVLTEAVVPHEVVMDTIEGQELVTDAVRACEVGADTVEE